MRVALLVAGFAMVFFISVAPEPGRHPLPVSEARAGTETAEADAEPVDRAGLAEVMKSIDREPFFEAAHKACPADIFATGRPFWKIFVPDTSVPLSNCEGDASSCYERCVGSSHGGACFSLARALQEHEADDKGSYWERMYAHACALGYAAGCTNRGAGIRNGDYANDPFRQVEPAAVELCLFRSFEIACREEDAWGCSMFGQAHHRGEGVAADQVKAARYYRKACAIDPDFPSCEFARQRLAEIEGGAAD